MADITSIEAILSTVIAIFGVLAVWRSKVAADAKQTSDDTQEVLDDVTADVVAINIAVADMQLAYKDGNVDDAMFGTVLADFKDIAAKLQKTMTDIKQVGADINKLKEDLKGIEADILKVVGNWKATRAALPAK